MTDFSERIKREFSDRPLSNREWHLQNTWCDCCGQADLGMERPTEYEINGHIFLSGFCIVCGHEIKSEIIIERSEIANPLKTNPLMSKSDIKLL